jgi:DNA-binding response OmpR family regulator
MLQEKYFDLVITDLMMPQGDGFAILRAVRDLSRAPDVIVLTGYPSVENERLCRELGCLDVMAKPFQVTQLRNQVNRCLENRMSGPTSGFQG